MAAIEPFPSRSSAGAADRRPAAGADARLAKLQVQLSDWQCCPSHSTPEGRAKIETITAQIAELKAQMMQSDSVRSDSTGPIQQRPQFRYDGQGTYLDLKA